MKRTIKILLFSILIILSKEDLCPENQINIDALGHSCITFEDFLEEGNLDLQSNNLLYLSSNDKGIIEKNNYKLEIFKLSDEKLQSFNIQKSKLYLSSKCLKAMEDDENIKLDKSNAIIVLIYNYNQMTENNLPDNYFIIRQSNPNSSIKYINSKTFDFSLCYGDPIYLDNQVNITTLKYGLDIDTPINVQKITYAKKLKIDLFDPHSEFLDDICFKFTSETKKDVPLDSRFEDYYQNITLCNESLSSHYIGFNYSDKDGMLTYRCAYGYYKNEEEKKSYIDNIDSKMKFLFKTSNIKVITCYEKLLNLREIIHNYGGLICIFVFLLQIILYICFCCKGTKYLEEEIQEMFETAEKRKKIIEIRKSQPQINGVNEIVIDNYDETNTNDRIQNSNNNEDVNNKETIVENNKNELEQGEDKKYITVKKDKNKGKKTKKSKKKGKNKQQENGAANPPKNTHNKTTIQKKKTFDIKVTNDKNIENRKIRKNKSVVVNNKKNELDEKKSEKEEEINELYEINDDDLNEFNFKTAIKRDKRNVCKLYWNALKTGHVIINLFCRDDDNNLVIIKISLLFILFPINLTFNIFFFTSKNIKQSYVKSFKDLASFAQNLLHSFLSSIFASVLLIILKFLCQTHSKIRELRKMKDLEEARKKNQGLYKWLKLRINLYFILSIIFIAVFGYYIACFCTIFENTQIDLIEAMFTSWGLSLLYPFGVYLVSSILRRIALLKKIRILFRISKILELY